MRKASMNIAKLLFCCSFCTALAFAQQSSEEKPFNTLRGFAYNPYGTLGAATTIADILRMPNTVYGHKFAYVLPVSRSGYSAFDLAGGSALLGFNESLILGYAKSFYGLLLNISPNMLCSKRYDDYECKGRYNIGLDFSVPLGSSIFYAYAAGWAFTNVTIDGNYSYNIYMKEKLSAKEAYIGITGGDILVWDLKLAFDYNKTSYSGYVYNEVDFTQDEFSFVQNMTFTKFLFNFGYKILQSDKVKFIVGSNNGLSCQYFSYPSSDIRMYNLGVMLSPNFFGEVALTKHLLAFVGAEYNFYSAMSLSAEDYYYNMEIEGFGFANSGSGAYAGLRYERENWAVETRLQSDAFGEILSGNNPFINLGVFIWLVL